MGRPPTKPKKLRDGYYIDVRNRGDKSGLKIRRDTLEEMERAVKEYVRTKEVIVLGECKNGKFVNPPIDMKKKK